MKFGWDIDGVLYNWHELVWFFYKDLYGVPNSTYREFWGPDGWAKQHEGTISMANMVEDPTMYNKQPIRREYLEAVNLVAKMVEGMWYITNRPPETKTDTARWLKNNKLPYADNLIFKPGTSKAEHIDRLQIDFYAEDRPKHIAEILPCKSLRIIYVVNQPWNQGIEDPKIVRVNSVTEIPANLNWYLLPRMVASV
jgi:uncharacterized HAD superfamily protein